MGRSILENQDLNKRVEGAFLLPIPLELYVFPSTKITTSPEHTRYFVHTQPSHYQSLLDHLNAQQFNPHKMVDAALFYL